MTINDVFIELDGVDCRRLTELLRQNGVGWPDGLEAHGAVIAGLQEPGQVLKITRDDVGGDKPFATLVEIIKRPE